MDVTENCNSALNFKWDSASENKATPDIQDKRAELRERFLWAVSSLNGKKCKIAMADNITVTGVMRGTDKDGLLVHMENLETPSGNHKCASLRLPDCLALNFEDL